VVTSFLTGILAGEGLHWKSTLVMTR